MLANRSVSIRSGPDRRRLWELLAKEGGLKG